MHGSGLSCHEFSPTGSEYFELGIHEVFVWITVALSFVRLRLTLGVPPFHPPAPRCLSGVCRSPMLLTCRFSPLSRHSTNTAMWCMPAAGRLLTAPTSQEACRVSASFRGGSQLMEPTNAKSEACRAGSVSSVSGHAGMRWLSTWRVMLSLTNRGL